MREVKKRRKGISFFHESFLCDVMKGLAAEKDGFSFCYANLSKQPEENV